MRGKLSLLQWETLLTDQLKGTDVDWGSLVHFYTQGTRSGMGSCGSFADWMRYVYWVRGRLRQIPPPYGVGGETGYTVPLIVTTWEREG